MHECPECGRQCDCEGQIAAYCQHYKTCQGDDYDCDDAPVYEGDGDR